MTYPDWPVLKSYEASCLRRVAMPLGGIGAGSISLGGHGELKDWELFNRPSKGFTPYSLDVGPCVMLHTRSAESNSRLFLAEGPIDSIEYAGCVGATRPNHGVPRFRKCRFDAAYPLAQISLMDEGLPLRVQLQAFSPVIPGDPDNSSLPIIQLRYHLHNWTDDELEVSAIATIPNFIGLDPQSGRVMGNGRFSFQGGKGNSIAYQQQKAIQGLNYLSSSANAIAENQGTFCLCTDAEVDVSYRSCWLDDKYHSALLDFLNDLDDDGRLDERPQLNTDIPAGSLAIHTNIPPGEIRTVTYYLTWHFPNRMDWTPGKHDKPVGNWYSCQFSDAWDAAQRIIPRMPSLEVETVNFVNAFCSSDLPAVVKEAMLFNLSTLFTETCHRLPDGTFCAYEGCGDHQAYCEGSCTHVWNYEHTLSFLFGGLARSMRDAEFGVAVGEQGDMVFRIMQPYKERGREFGRVAADGQMGCILKMYRDWQLSGDQAWLDRLWPAIRKTMAYCWIPHGWDADQDGVMEGCQHNTMDVEYYGPNPQMQGWYLGALKAASLMARACGDTQFADQCQKLFLQGSAWTDKHLFNGEYYEQQFCPPAHPEKIPPGQRLFEEKPEDGRHQLLDACLVDQMVGQAMAGICGLGDLLNPAHVKVTLASIACFNVHDGFHHHFNAMRSFVLGDEKALLMASYPHNPRPEFPFPYFSEAMTGFEYTAAIGMIYSGLRSTALDVVENIRDRYDGHKRNPFSEAECGHHYARAMAAWGAGLAWTGFSYSAVDQAMEVNGEDGQWFWSNGYAWGRYEICGMRVKLTISYGQLPLTRFSVCGRGSVSLDEHQNPLSPQTLKLALT